MNLNFEKININAIKENLFAPNSKGYYWLENFLEASEVINLLNFYNKNLIESKKFIDKNFIYRGCPPYSTFSKNKNTLVVFPWNENVDKTVCNIFNAIANLKNKCEDDKYNSLNFAMSMRFVDSFNLAEDVPLHQDYIQNLEDESRIQASLFLSEPGLDFDSSGGFYFKNSSEEIYPHNELRKVSGSLLLFKYRLPHGVKNIVKLNRTNGFCRVIFPEVQIRTRPTALKFAMGKFKVACKRMLNKYL